MLKRFHYLPQSLQVILLTYVAGPFAFLAACLINVPAVLSLPRWYVLAAILSYGVGPLVAAYLLLIRSRSFLYAFVVWGLVLIGLAFAAPGGLPKVFILVHATFAMALVMTALVFVNRDLLLPLMFPERRGWRLAPRVPVNHRARILLPRLSQEAPRELQVMIEDCSLTGLAVYGPEEMLAAALEDTVKGEAAIVTCSIARRTFEVPMYCMWQSRAAGMLRMGLKANDQGQMGQFFEALQPDQQAQSVPSRLKVKWGGRTLRRSLNYALAAFLLSLMLLPPLFLDNGPGRSALQALAGFFDGHEKSGDKPDVRVSH